MSASEFTPRFRWQLGLRDARNLSKAAKLVGHTLALHMDANGESCYPGVRLVAEETAQTTDTVCGAIDELLQARFLRVAVAASGRRPCKYAARLDCVPPIRTQGGVSVPSSRTQTGDVASDSDDVASESAERCVRKDGTEGSRGNTGGGPAPTSARADDAAVEKRKRRARDEARNVGHHYPEADLRAKLHEDGFGCDEINGIVAEVYPPTGGGTA